MHALLAPCIPPAGRLEPSGRGGVGRHEINESRLAKKKKKKTGLQSKIKPIKVVWTSLKWDVIE